MYTRNLPIQALASLSEGLKQNTLGNGQAYFDHFENKLKDWSVASVQDLPEDQHQDFYDELSLEWDADYDESEPDIETASTEVAGIIRFNKGQRVMVNTSPALEEEPCFYVGVITKYGRKKCCVRLDNGQRVSYRPDKTLLGLVGLVSHNYYYDRQVPSHLVPSLVVYPVCEIPQYPKPEKLVKFEEMFGDGDYGLPKVVSIDMESSEED